MGHHTGSVVPADWADLGSRLGQSAPVFGLRPLEQPRETIFADADPAGNVRRLFIAQFESMLPQHRKDAGFQCGR